MSRLRRFGTLAVIACAALVPTRTDAADNPPTTVATDTTVRAAPGGEALLSVEPAVTSSFDPGDQLLVRVRVDAPELLEGRIEIRRAGNSLIVAEQITVTAGSTVELVMAAPAASDGSTTVTTTVALIVDGDELDTDTVRFSHSADIDAVGVLPRLAMLAGDPPARVTLAGEVRRVELHVVDPAVLELGLAGFSQLETVAATSADLAGLSPTARDGLLVWLDHGGTLVLDDAAELGALPAEWRPGPSGYAFAGAGEVRVVDGLLSAGAWSLAIPPTALSGFESPRGFGAEVIIDPRLTLAERAGVALPNLTTILVVLVAYVVVVGPLLFVVLRRIRRLTTAWLVIPAVAALLAGGILVTGSSWRSGGRPTSSTTLEVGPAGGYAYVDALVYRRSGGTARLELPDGWQYSESSSGWFWFSQGDSSVRRLELGGGAPRLETDLEPGQITVMGVEGPTIGAPLKVVAHAAAGGRISGTVTNAGSFLLRSVAVFAVGDGVLVGDLAPGATAEFTLEDRLQPFEFGSSVVTEVWPDERFAVGFRSSPAGSDLGIWSSYAMRRGDGLFPSGTVRAGGWLADQPSALGAELANATLVTSLGPIGAGEGPLSPSAVRRATIAGPWDPQNGQQQDAVTRFVVPPGTDQALVLELSDGITDAQALDPDGKWVELEPVGGSDRLRTLPPELVERGAVTVSYAVDITRPVDVSLLAPTLRGAEG